MRRGRQVVGALVLLLLAQSVTAAAADCRLDLPRSATQGGLVIGRVDPACTVSLGTRKLRVASDGTFLFGIGRDAPASVTLDVRDPTGKATRAALSVTPREYRIERVDGVPQSTVTPDPQIAERIAREQAAVAEARERDDAREDFRFGFAWPARGRVSGVYGSQRVLNGTPKDPHYGLDIAAPTGTPIAAPAAGLVTFARPDLYLTGGTVLLDHGHGLSSVFIHMSRVDVAIGQRIAQGQVIGAVGMTGRATGPHLHGGMNWFDVRVDPQLLLPPPL